MQGKEKIARPEQLWTEEIKIIERGYLYSFCRQKSSRVEQKKEREEIEKFLRTNPTGKLRFKPKVRKVPIPKLR